MNPIEEFYNSPSQKNFLRLMKFWGNLPVLEVSLTCLLSDGGLPIYIDNQGNVYLDMNFDEDRPELYITCNDGKPVIPVYNWLIVPHDLSLEQVETLAKKCRRRHDKTA